MERSTQRNGLVNLLALLVVGAAGFAVANYSNTLAGQVSIVFLGIGLLVALVSWFQMRLEDNERLERLELDELAKGHSGTALFEGKEIDVFPAQRSREQFERFFVPIFTSLLCLLQAGAAYFLWRWLSKSTTVPDLKQPTTALALFGLFALVLFLLGRFSATYARLENNRLLRPAASYLLLNAFLCAVVAAGIVVAQFGFPEADRYAAFVLCALLALVAAETLVNLVLEIYRPRVKGKLERPLYESRLVGLLGQPEGLVTTAAQALDYQFGFKVSETWFYRFFEKALGWLLLMQLGALLLSTCVVFIQAGERGVREHFGKRDPQGALLEPGAHLKWPWPIDKVYRYRTDHIQTVSIGLAQEEEEHEEPTVLWTVSHTKEENFLVANRETALSGTPEGAAKRTPPVSFLTGSVPVQYQITNLVSWVYNNDDGTELLKALASREVVRFLAAADMNEILSTGRLEASQLLAEQIQKAVDNAQLGVHIVAASLGDMHPPVKVAQDYENVVSALQKKAARILDARAEDIRTNALAGARAADILNRAQSEAVSRTTLAFAQAALFTNQIPVFQAAPSVYAQRAYLQTFVRGTANARKYVVLTTNTQDVLTFDLQTKIREDLLNMNVTPKK